MVIRSNTYLVGFEYSVATDAVLLEEQESGRTTTLKVEIHQVAGGGARNRPQEWITIHWVAEQKGIFKS